MERRANRKVVNKCPLCGSENITYGWEEEWSDDTRYWQKSCRDCGATWKVVYDLVFDECKDIFDGDGNEVLD